MWIRISLHADPDPEVNTDPEDPRTLKIGLEFFILFTWNVLLF